METKKIIIAVLIVLVLGAGGYYFYTKNNDQSGYPFVPEVIPTTTPPTSNSSDSDKDGLPDSIEKVLGTNINNADTDGDSYDDLVEIKNGHNPLMAGAGDKYTPEEWQTLKDKIKIADKKFYEKNFETLSPPSQSPNPTANPTANPTIASFNCGISTVKDIDSNVYNTVKIGEQCWLKENLKVTKNPAGEAITRYCYDNDPKICDTDGGLYDWNTTMNSSTVEGSQGICPNGWHVPKDSEWYILENGLKDPGQTCSSDRGGKALLDEWDCASAGIKLQKKGSSGFEGIFTGQRGADRKFFFKDTSTSFWSSTERGSSAWSRFLSSLALSPSKIYRDTYEKIWGKSVRCLKD